MILHLYFARRFLTSLGAAIGAFFAILALLEFVDQIRRFDPGETTLLQLAGLTLLQMPQALYTILPLIVILATLALFLGLARSSELVVTRAAGRSALRALVAPVIAAILTGVVGVLVLNPIVAATTSRYETLSDRYAGNEPRIVSVSREGLWLRQGGADGQTVIRAARANLDGTILTDVSFLGFDTDGTPLFRIEAEGARLQDGAWQVTGAKRWRLDGAGNAEAEAETLERLRIASPLTADQIRDSFGTPSSIPIWDLPAFIQRLEQAGVSARQHRVWLQMELANPLLLAAMVLTAAAFTLRHTRFGKTGIMVLMALVMGFSLYFIRNFAQILGENGQIPVLLAAWGPPVAAVLLPLGLLLHLEDG
jgi:lipopolysaccharide export system permease protein